MSLVVVPGGASDVVLRSGQDVEDFEQEMVDEYALAMAA
jgi:integrase/recombinase XerC